MSYASENSDCTQEFQSAHNNFRRWVSCAYLYLEPLNWIGTVIIIPFASFSLSHSVRVRLSLHTSHSLSLILPLSSLLFFSLQDFLSLSFFFIIITFLIYLFIIIIIIFSFLFSIYFLQSSGIVLYEHKIRLYLRLFIKFVLSSKNRSVLYLEIHSYKVDLDIVNIVSRYIIEVSATSL
jgi:hypothetical protein